MDFKVPQSIPQDLLLIQEYVYIPPPAPIKKEEGEVDVHNKTTNEDDNISSSDGEDENASEEEIAADLIKGAATDEDDVVKDVKSISEPSDCSSETSSDEESDSSEKDDAIRGPRVQQDIDDDEDPVPAAASGTYFQTKHEIAELEVPIPEVDEVGADEVLEKVGEVMNIMDRVAIIRGLPSEVLNRGSDRALDSETLLVFEDKKVMGYIYETFGPTTQPLYQVKFNTSFPLDPERVRVGREVFHVPTRSHFIFVNQIKAIKGSDASNVHDEEPGDDELEFSDDEAEAAYRSRLKRKRGESRARSVASSRQSTPNPSHMRDQELADETFFSRNAYDEHGPYDIDYTTAGPSSRPAPIPYDDPYGEEYTAPDVVDRESRSDASSSSRQQSFDRREGRHDGNPYERAEGRGRGRGGRGRDRDRDRGRNRGGDRGGHRDRDRGGNRDRDGGGNRDRDSGRGGGARGRGRGSQRYGSERPSETSADSYESQARETRSMSPTSLAIARATGQEGYSGSQQQQQHQYSPMYSEVSSSSWGYGQMPMQSLQYQQQYGYMQQGYQPQQQGQGFVQAAPFVQPHINPRFASAFGIPLSSQQQQGFTPIASQHQPYPFSSSSMDTASASATPPPSSSAAQSHWSDEWAVPVEQRFPSGEESKNSNQ